MSIRYSSKNITRNLAIDLDDKTLKKTAKNVKKTIIKFEPPYTIAVSNDCKQMISEKKKIN
jgi:hypothetical protein